MLRHALATAIVVTAASAAHAQPGEMRAESCGVTLVHAPDEVRYVIEQWLRAEPRCTSQIELRVVPTDGGLYLLAQRPDGRIHERLVPDAQSAGVLVASWVADDWTAPPPAAAAPAPAAMLLTVIVDPLRVGPPGQTSVTAAAPASRPHRPGKWPSLGMLVQPEGDGDGFRAEAEVLGFGAWKLGAVFWYKNGGYLMESAGWTRGSISADDAKVIAYLSGSWNWGRWELRGGIGAGVVMTDIFAVGEIGTTSPFSETQGGGTFAVGELSGLLTRRLGESWGLGLGPVVTLVNQHYDSPEVNAKIERTTPQLMLFGGLRYEL